MVPVHSIYTAHTKQGFVQNMMIVYCSYYDASMMEVYIYISGYSTSFLF